MVDQRRRFWSGPGWLILITAIAVSVAGPWAARRMEFASRQAATERSRAELSADQFHMVALSESFRTLAQAVEESVVHIRVFGTSLDMDGLGTRGGRPSGIQELTSGSGWVYRMVDGDRRQDVVITNHHVVANGDEIRVRFRNRQEAPARLLGSDARTDIAVLQVSARLIPAVVATAPAEQGDLVFAFGSPFGYEFSMSQGIVSATGRHPRRFIGSMGGYENFIQTDAAINPGNSGGPLTNVLGQVVGMNTAIRPRTGDNTFAGVGFAIPVGRITYVADQLIRNGVVERGFLGVSIRTVEADEARRFGHNRPGVLVNEVFEGQAAAEAGLKPMDLLIEFEGQPLLYDEELRNLVADLMPGTRIRLTLLRDGERISVEVTLKRLPDSLPTRSELNRTLPDQASPRMLLNQLGLIGLQEIDAAHALGLFGENVPGVLVQSVTPRSAAADASIEPGMLIVRVGDTPVRTREELARQLSVAERGGRVPLYTRLAGRETRLYIRIPEESR
ncbi:MAG: trypsin-like peptidase domain-containing protein [Phycisphaeraceae bacterium]|nr:trypsin-like peptidase domain-containing protein [Phycisphaeraceae bacterium]